MTDNGQEKALRKQNQRRRHLRNYLLDWGLQLRYTLAALGLVAFLTTVLGYEIYQATQETSRAVALTGGNVDPALEKELREQFRSSDRSVLYVITGFGVVLMLSVAGAGIWMTHKVAGPLHNIAATCSQVRNNQLPPTIRQIRRGDLLHGFFAGFSEMYGALRARVNEDIEVLSRTIAAIEAQPARSAELEEALGKLREMQQRKQESLQPHEKLN